jgi:hypothetical protein
MSETKCPTCPIGLSYIEGGGETPPMYRVSYVLSRHPLLARTALRVLPWAVLFTVLGWLR